MNALFSSMVLSLPVSPNDRVDNHQLSMFHDYWQIISSGCRGTPDTTGLVVSAS